MGTIPICCSKSMCPSYLPGYYFCDICNRRCHYSEPTPIKVEPSKPPPITNQEPFLIPIPEIKIQEAEQDPPPQNQLEVPELEKIYKGDLPSPKILKAKTHPMQLRSIKKVNYKNMNKKQNK